MVWLWYVLALFDGIVAIATIITGGDAAQTVLLGMLCLILAKVSELGKQR